MTDKAKNAFNMFRGNPRALLGGGAVLLAAGSAYGVMQSIFTGKLYLLFKYFVILPFF